MSNMDTYDKKKQGYVFNIQPYSVHDGPGIRTIVFLKGCPLSCRWCSNPESQKHHPELAYKDNSCIGVKECGMCLEVCEYGAIEKDDVGKIKIIREKCIDCLKCVDVCPAKALITFGSIMSVKEVVDAVEKDSIFYARSEGGLTLSGGESLAQPEFASEILKEAKRRRISTSIETCGCSDWESMEMVAQYLDTIMFDIKSMNEEKHKEFTGASNEKILANLKKLRERFPKTPILVRTPVIPGFNDTEEDILAIVDFIKDMPNVKYELLAYHRLGEAKYGYVGRDYLLSGVLPMDEGRINVLRKLAYEKMGQQ